MKTRYSVLLSTAASMALVSTPAYAQEAEVPEEVVEEVSDDDEQVITVTGSRIRVPNLEGT